MISLELNGQFQEDQNAQIALVERMPRPDSAREHQKYLHPTNPADFLL
jgi:hypothetical protein